MLNLGLMHSSYSSTANLNKRFYYGRYRSTWYTSGRWALAGVLIGVFVLFLILFIIAYVARLPILIFLWRKKLMKSVGL